MMFSGLGKVTNARVNEELRASESAKMKKPQSKYTKEDRFKIAKCATHHWASQAATIFKGQFPKIRESTVRGFLKKYREQENKGHRQNNKVPTLKRGRPLMIIRRMGFTRLLGSYNYGTLREAYNIPDSLARTTVTLREAYNIPDSLARTTVTLREAYNIPDSVVRTTMAPKM